MLECLTMRGELARWRGGETSAAQSDALYMQLLADQQTGENDVGLSA